MGRKRSFFIYVLMFLVLLCSSPSSASRVQRTAFEQAMGTIRKVEEMYASDNPEGKYTENLFDLAPYTNVTNLLKDFGTGKFIIELNQDKTFYTVTTRGKDRCLSVFAATYEGVALVSKSNECIQEEKIDAIINSIAKVVGFIFLTMLIFFYVQKVKNDVKEITQCPK